MKTIHTLRKFLCCALYTMIMLFSLSLPASAATADDFRTDEYENSTGLEAIRAADAYALGFTGKGVTVGVVDSVFAPEESEFAGKYPYGQFMAADGDDDGDDDDPHGIHVSGIIAAAKNNQGMHGAAYNATLLPFQWDWDLTPDDLLGRYEAHDLMGLIPSWKKIIRDYPQVKIINNSWGVNYFLDESYGTSRGDSSAYFFQNTLLTDSVASPVWLSFIDTAKKAVAADKLLIMAAGNEGHLSPNFTAGLPSLLAATGDPTQAATARALSLNWINVAAFDSSSTPGSPAFVAPFTNMGQSASGYTLWAPGVDINSTTSASTYAYEDESGTSFAAPYISGVAALTQEAFPYMGGKQLADVLLSTATPFSAPGISAPGTVTVPNIILLSRKTYTNESTPSDDVDDDSVTEQFQLYYPVGYGDSSVDSPIDSIEQLAATDKKALIELIMNDDDTYTHEDAESALQDIIDSDNTTVLQKDDYLELFGVGIVNAAKAVRGPGYFDANRLSADAVDTDYGAAMYSVDSKGYDSTWSNDIGQRIVSDPLSALYNLDVGLRKQGAGILYLAGNNSYAGPTVVDGGILNLTRTGILQKSNVLVNKGGGFDLSGSAMQSVTIYSGGTLNARQGGVIGGDLNAAYTGAVLNFYVPSGAVSGNTMLTVTKTAHITDSTVNVGIDGASSPLQTGNHIVLIDAGTLDGNPANSWANGAGMQGVSLLYDFTFSRDSSDKKLLAILATDTTPAPVPDPVNPPVAPDPVNPPVAPDPVNPPVAPDPVNPPATPPLDPVRVNPQTKALVEGFLAGVALVNLGADVAAGQGMDAAVNAAHEGQSSGNGLNTFGALSGGWSRYKTGSHVDMSSISLMVGLAAGSQFKPGNLTLGVFFEYGNGSYDTYNSFSSMNSVKGDGDMDYMGGGILGRFASKGSDSGHFYVEAALRAGRVHNDYSSGDLRDAWGRKAKYEDSSAAYYGLHGGAGYVFNLSEKANLDFYGKYFWTHQEGDNERLSTGDPVSFAGINSQRGRVGTRVSYALSAKLTPYIGAAVEREFDGKARASTNGFAIDAPSIKGNTGIGELGLSYKPSGALPLFIDLGAHGYVGKREGVTGSLQVKYTF